MKGIDATQRYDIDCLTRALTIGQTIQFDVPAGTGMTFNEAVVASFVGSTFPLKHPRGQIPCRVVAAVRSRGGSFVRLTLERDMSSDAGAMPGSPAGGAHSA